MWHVELAQRPLELRAGRKRTVLLLFRRWWRALDLHTNANNRGLNPLDDISETQRGWHSDCIYLAGIHRRAAQQVASRKPDHRHCRSRKSGSDRPAPDEIG